MPAAEGDATELSLELFHPTLQRWFREQVGTPTDAQATAWPHIAANEHVLVTAPTGSGKTLTAFLWALNQLITGQWPEGHTSVLYVSPLRALNNDIRRNLLTPLEQLAQYFEADGIPFPVIRPMTRSDDTFRRHTTRRPAAHAAAAAGDSDYDAGEPQPAPVLQGRTWHAGLLAVGDTR